MLVPEKLTLSGLSRGKLEALAERLLAGNAALKQAIAELRAEVAALKGVKGRPKVRPSGMDEGTGPKPAGKRPERSAKGSKSERFAIDEEQVIAADVPAGSRFKGYEDFLVQDLVLHTHVVRIRRERWLTPDGRTVTAPMPAGIVGHSLRAGAAPVRAVSVPPGSGHGAPLGGPAFGPLASRSPSGSSCGC